jgi:long-chain acyl-CoA synthetase
MSGAILSGDRRLDKQHLDEIVARGATALANLGVGEGDCVATLLRNDFAFFEASFAADRLGAYAVPINWHFKANEIGYILQDSAAKALIVHQDLLGEVTAILPDGIKLIVVDTPSEIVRAYDLAAPPAQPPSASLRWEALIAKSAPWGGPVTPGRNAIIYTSGTTGKPKGVRRAPADAAMAASMARLVETALGLSPTRPVRTVITGPMYHAAPNLYGLWAARAGGLVILQPKFEPEALLALIATHAITHVHMVPTMFSRLLALPEATRRGYDLSSLEFVAHAAAPCPPHIKRAMIEWWGPVIREYYGGTETGGAVACTSEEALAKPGTVGKAMEGCALRIISPDGAILGPEEVGEVYIRNSAFPDFTYHQREKDRAAIERDGFVSLGDIGYLDDDGFLFLRDRARDIIISGGVNIYPAEIEAELLAMPEVADCAVFGIPHPEFGEQVCAVVEPRPGADPDLQSVRAFLQPRLADFKLPRVLKIEMALPREDSGKIFKRRLRDPYWIGHDRQI